MRRRHLHTAMTAAALLGVLLGSCGPQPPPTAPLPSQTPPPPDAVPPVIIQRTPQRGEELPHDGTIELVFDRAMDRSSVEAAFRVSPHLSGNIEWTNDRTARFKPAGDLERDTEYSVTIGHNAKASDGNQLDGTYRFRFRTVGYLKVAQVIPAPDTRDIEAESIITVIFNRPVVPLTAVSDPGRQSLPQPLTFAPSVEGSGEWLNTSIYAFTPDEPLAGGTLYTARIAAGLTDSTGGILAEDYSWSFATQPPQVTWVSPKEGADLVSVEPTVQVTFNMPVDPVSAENAFHLRGDGKEVQGSVEVHGAALVFTPTSQLDFDRTYTARIGAGVHSAGGGEGMQGAYEWRLSTVPLPRIVRTSPYNGQQDAYPYTSFEIVFNAPIDPGTVMPNLEMTPPLSATQVHTYSHGNTFVFSFGVQPSTDYEVRLGPGVADPYGNTTGQEMTIRFRTASLSPWVQLDVPGMIGTYDANQPAHMALGYLNTTRLDLSLYRLPLEEFFRAQEDWWEYHPSGNPIRKWSVPVEAPLNETAHTVVELVEGGGELEPGLYLVDVHAPGVTYERWRQRKLLAVSKCNLTLKTGQSELWAWATDLATGRPVNGLRLTLRGTSFSSLSTATTDEDGLAHFTFDVSYRDSLYVAAEEPFVLGGVGREWGSGIRPWDFGLQMDYGDTDHRAHIYSDRPLYRPGQTVYFRGIVRTDDDARYTLPKRETAFVKVQAASGEEIYNEELELDEFGAFHDELTLGEGAALGDYRIEAKLGDEAFHATFAVAAYRPPEFELIVTPEKEELAAGQATQADVEVRYFFGGCVADAQIEWRVLSAAYRFEPDQFGRYDFSDDDTPWICRWCWWEQPASPRPVLTGSGTTDARGHLSVSLPTRVMTGGQRLTIEATAYGKDGQAISGRSDVVVHQGDFYIGLAPQQHVGQARQELAVDIVTVDWEGERLPDRSLDVEIYRREWVNTFVEDEFGGGRWEWETVDTLVYTDTLTTDSQAEGLVTFTPHRGGSYHVVVTGRDRRERLVRSSTWVWVSGAEYVPWRRQNSDRITLISDKATYFPGETAEILIPSPFQGEQWAWITVERGGLLHQEVRPLESNSTVYRLPITAEHAPNVYVSVVIVKGPDATDPVATQKVGYVPLTVEPVEQELNVTLTPSVERAEPGNTVSFDVEASGPAGEPVQVAFSLDLVDKAVLSLRPRRANAIQEAFYGKRGLGVSTASGLAISINRLLLEQMENIEQRVAAQGLGRGGGGGEGEEVAEEVPAMPAWDAKTGSGKAVGLELRERFEDTAFWDAAVFTDRAGRARVEIELPDNVTTWVFRGVGVTADTKVGEKALDLLATKPLLVRPVTPRFFVVGDRAQLAALVSNNTGEAQEVEVTLHAEGLALGDPAAQTVSIPDGAEAKVTWWVTAEDVETADVAMRAAAGDYSDAARPRLATGPKGTLLVHRYTAPEVVGTGGQLMGEEARTEVVALPPKYDDREGELSIRLDPSLAAATTHALDYLEHFPYECTEQTVSRFLPNVLTYRGLRELGLSDPELEEKLLGLVAEGLSKLYKQQHADGGWGWWPEGESNPHLTAYVVFAMGKAREASFEVRGGVIGRGLGYLESKLVSVGDLQSYREANRQAFALYAMAEAGETNRASEYAGQLYRRRARLSHYGCAFLAMTLGLIDAEDQRIATLLSDMENAAILSATGAHWEEENYDYWAMNTDTRSTAVALDALVRLDPENGLIPNVVRWLMAARRDGIWETTQETAWALIALTDWMVLSGELKGEYDYGVWLNEEMLDEGSVAPGTVSQPIELQVDVAELLPDKDVSNRLTIARGPGKGRLYYTAHLNVTLPVEEIEPLDRGIIISRQYGDPTCTEGVKCPEVTEAAVGDLVKVRLTIIAPHDLYYVVVEDPLPAGAEAIDPSLETTSLLEQEPQLYRETEDDERRRFYDWWWRWYSRSEIRDDKVVLFADYLPAGTYEYVYAFRATQPGAYRVIPTTAHEFYFPEVFGRADGRLFAVTEAQ